MKTKYIKLLKRSSSLLILLGVMQFAFGQSTTEHYIDPLLGANIIAAEVLTLTDDVCDDFDCDDFTLCEYKSFIKLGIDFLSSEDVNNPYITGPSNYNVQIVGTVDYIKNDGTIVDDEAVDLSISFARDGGITKNQDIKILDGGYLTILTITSVTFTDPNGASPAVLIPNDVYLTLGYKKEAYLELSSNSSVITMTEDITNGIINFSWTDIEGAEYYDLEWLWKDNEVYGSVATPNYRHDATRITVSESSYSVPNIYRKGAIYARVRAIGRMEDVCDEYIHSAWYTDDLNSLSIDGHQENLNWSHTRSYAEEGKKKDVISYADGSLRARQSITKLESDNYSIGAESFYDHVGRPAVQVLPSPIIDGTAYANKIDYYPLLNQSATNIPYDNDQFEVNEDDCYAPLNPLLNTSGSAQYYSSNNPIKDEHQAYVPEANGYPLSQTKLTNDPTGRVRSQGGVGEAHQIGAADTRYFYGVPDQMDLDRLFGNDVGIANYYTKSISLDPNGQVSVSYADNKGRVVATALAGAAPAALEALPSATATYTNTTDLMLGNTIYNEGSVDAISELVHPFVVSAPSDFELDYNIIPTSFNDPCTEGTASCYDCVYELQIQLTDDCGNSIYSESISEDMINVDFECNSTLTYSVDPTITLDVGSYGLSKRLSMNKAALEAYKIDYIENNDCILSELEIFEQILAEVDFSGCSEDLCITDCIDDLDIGDFIDSESFADAIRVCVQDKINSNDPCLTEPIGVNQCQLLLDAIRRDMTPHGQYAEVMNDDGVIARAGLSCSSFYAESSNNMFNASYEDVNFGGIMLEVGGVMYAPNELSYQDFVSYFDETWLDAIIPYHPEYVYYTWCMPSSGQTISSAELQRLMFDTESQVDALSLGYLNPLGHSASAIGYNIGSNNILDGAHIQEGTIYNDLYSRMEHFSPTDVAGQFYSMWDMAYMMTVANIVDFSAVSSISLPGQFDDDYSYLICNSDRFWQNFRSLFIATRKEIQDAELDNYVQTNGDQSLIDCIGIEDATGCVCLDLETNYRNYYSSIGQGYDFPIDIDAIINDPSIVEGEINAALTEICSTKCDSYTVQWRSQLAGCGLSQQDEDNLMNSMVTICIDGCDATHTEGSSSNSDGTASFKTAMVAAGIAFTEVCNDLLITFPYSYDHNIYAGDSPIIDDCVCSQYDQIYGEYELSTSSPDFNGFYAFLVDQYNVEFDAEAIIELSCACDVSDDIKQETIVASTTIPEPFACIACADCYQVSTAYDAFLDLSYLDDMVDVDYTYTQAYRVLMSSFMNDYLDFNLSATEYLDFLQYCGTPLTNVTAGNIMGLSVTTGSSSSMEKKPSKIELNNSSNQNGLMMVSDYEYTIELSTDKKVYYAGETIVYDHFIVNTGNYADSGYYRDTLPDGFLFTSNPINLPSNIVVAGGLGYNYIGFGFGSQVGDTLHWQIEAQVPENIYISKAYTTQSDLLNGLSLMFYSDDPETTEINDPTSIFVAIEDPCLNPVEEEQDMLDFITTIHANYLDGQSSVSTTIALSTLANYDFYSSSINLWPSVSINNLSLQIDYNNNLLSLVFINTCDNEVLCQLEFADFDIVDLHAFTSIENEISAASTGSFALRLHWQNTSGYTHTVLGTSSCYSFIACEKRLLCNRSINLTIIDESLPCLDLLLDISLLDAQEEYIKEIKIASAAFKIDYVNQCLNQASISESFDMQYENNEYHHTLYYYDQSGSLVKTIPPSGTDYLDHVEIANVGFHRINPAGVAAVYPLHEQPTKYQYNSFNELVQSNLPDADYVERWYDHLGRPLLAQDGRQRALASNSYTYFIYDPLGRIIETGELSHLTPISNTELADYNGAFMTWFNQSVTKIRVSRSIYDVDLNASIANIFDSPRLYLRKRISSTLFYENYSTGTEDYDFASHYDYDVHGNVKTLFQEYKELESIGQSLKRMDYFYDLISGNVNRVSYQANEVDAFYHRYSYDSDNRLTKVETSQDTYIWDVDAEYIYYDHGPLARVELGDHKVQGMDYAYTLHGWIKGVNSNTLIYNDRDIGKDGLAGHTHELVGDDVMGYSLQYFHDDVNNIADYNPIGTITQELSFTAEASTDVNDLYNGNISAMVTSLRKEDGTALEQTPNVYVYDQLHRIISSTKYTQIQPETNSWANATATNQYKSAYTYDPNGNIQTLERYNGSSTLIDNLSYSYADQVNAPSKNQLLSVDDAIAQGIETGDFDDQNVGNYIYDESGNMIKDHSEKILNIVWDQNNKIRSIIREGDANLADQPEVHYSYDAAGNRIVKRVKKGSNDSDWEYSYYVRDASGNVMGVYKGVDALSDSENIATELYEKEFHMYGSSMLGIKHSDSPTQNLDGATTNEFSVSRTAGIRSYQLSNHLGNVLSTISDNLILEVGNGYAAEVLSYSDYYPFGWEMAGRSGSSANYRYGFNGKEKDADLSGNESLVAYDYGFRIYNPSIAKFLSVDPLAPDYPWYTPYQFAGNMPIWAIDLDGLEEWKTNDGPIYGPWANQDEAEKAVSKTDFDWFRNTETVSPLATMKSTYEYKVTDYRSSSKSAEIKLPEFKMWFDGAAATATTGELLIMSEELLVGATRVVEKAGGQISFQAAPSTIHTINFNSATDGSVFEMGRKLEDAGVVNATNSNISRLVKTGGKIFVIGGIAWDAKNTTVKISNSDDFNQSKLLALGFGLRSGLAVYSMSNPYVAGGLVVHYVVDSTIGWETVLHSVEKTVKNDVSKLPPIWFNPMFGH